MTIAIAPLSSEAIIAELGFTPADDGASVHLTGDETIAGVKTFSTPIADGSIASAAAWNAKQAALDFTPEDVARKATNFATVNDTLYPTVAAVKAYADALVVGLLDDRGNFDASGNVFPSSGGSGTAGAILKGDLWLISVAGTLGGNPVAVGDQIRALTDTPGQTAGNWGISEANIGYVSENVANKATSLSTLNNTLYPTTQAVANYAQPLSANLTTFAAIAPSANVVTLLGAASYAAFKASLSLENVENTALSTWGGSANIVTLGTISAGALPESLVTFTDITTGNVSITKHGFAPKLPNDATKYLDGTGSYTVPSSSGASVTLNNLSVGAVAINTALTTGAGVAAALTATAPVQTTGAQAGVAASLTASAAVAGSSTVGAANGGSVSITAGNAAQLTSGNGNGGSVTITLGTAVGSGTAGILSVVGTRGVTANRYQFTNASGLIFDGTNANLTLQNVSGSTVTWLISSGRIYFGSAYIVGWTSAAGADGGTNDVGIGRNAAGILEVNSTAAGTYRDIKVRQYYADQTITAGGTTGNQTINKAAGTVNIAAGQSAVTVTCNLCTTSSEVYAVVRTNDTTAYIKNVVPGAGSFTINLGAAATAEVSIGFLVVN